MKQSENSISPRGPVNRLFLDERSKKIQTSEQLLKTYQDRLQQAIAMFYDQVCDDETKNEAMFENFNMAWKKTANAVNATQKHTHIDPFAFEKEIEEYKRIALERLIEQQENGTLDNIPQL